MPDNLLRIVLMAWLAATAAGCVSPQLRGDAFFSSRPSAFSVQAMSAETGLVVPVSVNGSEPLPFLLDTGATRSALYPRGAAAAGLSPTGETSILRSLGRVDEVPRGALDRLSFGEISKSDVPVLLLEQSNLRPELAGILGIDVLADRAIMWNPDLETLSVIVATEFRDQRFGAWHDVGLLAEAGSQPAQDLLFARSRINLKNLFVLVDSGAENSLMNWKAAESSPILRLFRARLRREWVLEGAVGTFSPTVRARVNRLSVGQFELPRSEIFILDMDPLDVGPDGPVPLLLMGWDVLGEEAFVIDFTGPSMFVRPAGTVIEPSRVISIGPAVGG